MFRLLNILVFCWKGSLKQVKINQKKKGEFWIKNLGNLVFFSFFLLGNLSSGKGIVRAGSGNN